MGEILGWEYKQETFKSDSELYAKDDFFYCLCNGYIKPEELLEDKDDIERLKEAIALVESFENSFYEHPNYLEM